jgi:hypothetical protein
VNGIGRPLLGRLAGGLSGLAAEKTEFVRREVDGCCSGVEISYWSG